MGSLRPRNSTRARKVRFAKSLPRPRRKPTPTKRYKPRTADDVLRDVEPIRKTREPFSARTKPQAAVPSAGRKRGRRSLPDLDSILDAFSEAFDLIQAAHMAQKQTDHWGPPEVAMNRGIAKLARVYNDFDRATIDLASFGRKQTKTRRGRS